MKMVERLEAEVENVADKLGIILTDENREMLLFAMCRGADLAFERVQEINKNAASQKHSA